MGLKETQREAWETVNEPSRAGTIGLSFLFGLLYMPVIDVVVIIRGV